MGVPKARKDFLKVSHTSPQEKTLAAPYPFFLEVNEATMIKLAPISTPGMMPPAKSLPTDAPVRNPKMIMGMDGGMITPMEPPEACTAAAKSES